MFLNPCVSRYSVASSWLLNNLPTTAKDLQECHNRGSPVGSPCFHEKRMTQRLSRASLRARWSLMTFVACFRRSIFDKLCICKLDHCLVPGSSLVIDVVALAVDSPTLVIFVCEIEVIRVLHQQCHDLL